MNWAPFAVAPQGQKGDAIRPLETLEGVGDRLRTAAFAELQAREAFRWAAIQFSDAPKKLCETWLMLACEEQKHLDWLLGRMRELGIPVQARLVSEQLWVSLVSCDTARAFTLYIASAEERGRKAGVRFYETLLSSDPKTAQIFGKIAEEEVSHVQLALKFFPKGSR
jgi:uncharacterized ferritin-like protein (DUF455 family)